MSLDFKSHSPLQDYRTATETRSKSDMLTGTVVNVNRIPLFAHIWRQPRCLGLFYGVEHVLRTE